MGHNATVVVSIDALHTIEQDPDFGKNLAAAIRALALPPEAARRRTTVAARAKSIIDAGAARAVECHHADGIRLVAVGSNTGFDLGAQVRWSVPTNELPKALLEAFAQKLGYRISKIPAKKAKT